MLFSAGGGTSTYISQAISGVDFAQILTEIVSVAPVVLPTVVTVMAFRKALRWVIGSVRRA